MLLACSPWPILLITPAPKALPRRVASRRMHATSPWKLTEQMATVANWTTKEIEARQRTCRDVTDMT